MHVSPVGFGSGKVQRHESVVLWNPSARASTRTEKELSITRLPCLCLCQHSKQNLEGKCTSAMFGTARNQTGGATSTCMCKEERKTMGTPNSSMCPSDCVSDITRMSHRRPDTFLRCKMPDRLDLAELQRRLFERSRLFGFSPYADTHLRPV